MSKKKSTKPRSNYEVYRSIRKDWGVLNPITKVIPDKRGKSRSIREGSMKNEE